MALPGGTTSPETGAAAAMWFAYFDGDDIGPFLELLLLDDKIEEAKAYSHRVSCAMHDLAESVRRLSGVDILVSGGDDLLAHWSEPPPAAWIDQLRAAFLAKSGRTMSVGIGLSASEATRNLRRAKLQGKNITVIKGA